MKTWVFVAAAGGVLLTACGIGGIVWAMARPREIEKRNMKVVDAIVLHQARCNFDPGPYLIKKNNGDVHAAKHERAMRVNAHLVALHCGHYVQPHSVDQTIAHVGLRANPRRSIGIETEGSYHDVETPGVEELDQATAEALRNALEFATRTAIMMGAPLHHILAHRQLSSERPGDPGGEIWRRVVLEWAVPQLGLMTLPKYSANGGRPIPLEWDPAGGEGHY
jgi:N-acetyl-anhydromuramyl-L-alanine amidase AmpD